jgi:hypothetical protein
MKLEPKCIDCGRWQNEVPNPKGHKWMLQDREERIPSKGPKPSLERK